MPVRYVKCVHLDGSIRSIADDGCNKQGEPNQQRSHLAAMLTKLTRVPKVDADGRARGFVMIEGEQGEEPRPLLVNVFRLAEAPARFPYHLVPEASRATIERVDRQFSDSMPMRNARGDWNVPDDAWLAHSRAWQAKKRHDAAEAEATVATAQRMKAGEAMETFLLEATRRKGEKQQTPRSVASNA